MDSAEIAAMIMMSGGSGNSDADNIIQCDNIMDYIKSLPTIFSYGGGENDEPMGGWVADVKLMGADINTKEQMAYTFPSSWFTANKGVPKADDNNITLITPTVDRYYRWAVVLLSKNGIAKMAVFNPDSQLGIADYYSFNALGGGDAPGKYPNIPKLDCYVDTYTTVTDIKLDDSTAIQYMGLGRYQIALKVTATEVTKTVRFEHTYSEPPDEIKLLEVTASVETSEPYEETVGTYVYLYPNDSTGYNFPMAVYNNPLTPLEQRAAWLDFFNDIMASRGEPTRWYKEDFKEWS